MAIDNEGSVVTEDSDVEVDEQSEETTEEVSNTEDTASTEENASTDTAKTEKSEITEKGTKLDTNPLSAANQMLANERAKVRQYEEVLNNPQLLRSYVSQLDKEEKTGEKELRYEDVQTTEDLHKYLSQQDRKVQEKLKKLDETISGVQSSQKESQVADVIKNDIESIRDKYPALNPKSDEYNPTLDKTIGELFEELDYDSQAESFQGKVRLASIADKVMQAAGVSRKQGSAEAQTQVRDRRAGRAVSGASNVTVDESNMTTGQIIAARVAAARKARG